MYIAVEINVIGCKYKCLVEVERNIIQGVDFYYPIKILKWERVYEGNCTTGVH